MPDISRRRFLRTASFGAAAAGTVAVVGPSALGLGGSAAGAAALGSKHKPYEEVLDTHASGKELMAHLVDDKSGTISLFVGTKKITLQDRELTQQLFRAAL